ncbi:hypothetical protein KY333_02680 [Candidatus Woesearchaeota archaeon]|nr:hypothetical protein [Candidatus Woesearchaeota archaeon]MBW2994162.1 hypothetical protein [Candidatus Woesearchaeota archaeon]
MKEQREEGIKQYNELREKTGLPKLEEFEKEFECRIQSPAIPGILNVLMDKLGQCCSHIEIIFQPGRMADAIEAKFHSEEEKKELFAFYKQVLSKIHEVHAAMFDSREARLREIKTLYPFYMKKVKPVMKKYLDTQAKAWLTEEKTEQKQYFG